MFKCSLYLLLFLLGCLAEIKSDAVAADKVSFAIALHGGAGMDPSKLTRTQKQEYRDSLSKAIETGREILARDGAALDAVEATIRTLEDDPLYNAGRGAVFNQAGKHELDASIMDGKTGDAGAVAGATTVKNPISLARLVMTETSHVLLAGDGAEKFADEMKSRAAIARVPNSYFSTESRRQEWMDAVAREKTSGGKAADGKSDKGTVGCVALDKHGNLAAGTSTGGLTNKKWGRVGDSPIIGAGEMGRTPRLNKNGGRDHFGELTPLLLAGGGLAAGQVVGSSEQNAERASTTPYSPANLFSTILHSLLDVAQLRLYPSVPGELLRCLDKHPVIAGLGL